jgi:hypothetical protein
MTPSLLKPACLLAAVAFSALSAPALSQVDGGVTAPFVTTPVEVVDRMLALAGTAPADYVVDLGSGDGRIVIAAAKKFGARGLGLELDPKLVAQSRENARAAGVADRTEFRVEDVLRADFSKATVVTVYLLPWLMAQLSPIFLDGLKPGARIVTHAFAFPSWRPDRMEKVKLAVPHPSQGDESTIYLWVVPANARGFWRAASPEGAWSLRIDQNFQEVDLEAGRSGAKLTVAEAKLSGDRLSFAGMLNSTPVTFTGRVAGSRIEGRAEIGPDKRVIPLVFAK